MKKITAKHIIGLLKHFDIPYWTSGNNVSDKSINIRCPFCSDHSNHLCIFKNGGNISCWRCNIKGSLFDALTEILGISYAEYAQALENLAIAEIKTIEQYTTEPVVIKSVILPELFKPITESAPPKVLEYLAGRDITLEISQAHNLHYCVYGKYSQRIIIPIYYDNQLVAWQGRDFSGVAPQRYMTSSSKETNPVNHFLYNYDTISDTAILVEGVFDAIAIDAYIEPGLAIASFGAALCKEQKAKLIKKNLKELIICWDEDKYTDAERIGNELLPLIEKIKVVRLPKGLDPAKLGKNLLNIILTTPYK